MKTKTRKPKIKIDRIYVERAIDDTPDTSWLGEYTSKPSPWSIDRRKNDFVCKIEQRERLIGELQERIEESEENRPSAMLGDNENNGAYVKFENYQKRQQKRIQKLEQSAPADCYIERNSYEYFTPAQHVPHNPENWDHVQGKERQDVIKQHGSIKKADYHYAKEDYERMEALNNGDFCFIGIIAKARILIPLKGNPGNWQTQTISSGGIWGIESDSSKKFIQEEAKSQLSNLASQLEAIGIGKRAIEYAIKRWNGELIDR